MIEVEIEFNFIFIASMYFSSQNHHEFVNYNNPQNCLPLNAIGKICWKYFSFKRVCEMKSLASLAVISIQTVVLLDHFNCLLFLLTHKV